MNVLQSFPNVVNQGGLQWLVFPDERSTGFTNVGDGRDEDTSSLVAQVNADPALNNGFTEWRLPTIDELKGLVGSPLDPKADYFWASPQNDDDSGNSFAPVMCFVDGQVGSDYRLACFAVRLVRTGPTVVNQAGLQWLVLPNEAEATYTNYGDGRTGDASELVTMVNADPAQNLGHTDWRLPTIDELKTLMGTADAPVRRWYWSTSPYVGPYGANSSVAWFVDFDFGIADDDHRSNYNLVRLVRACQ